MFSGSFMVIAVLVVFSSQDESGQVNNTTIATTIPVSTSTPSLSPKPSASLSQSATSRATSTTPTLSNTNFISQTSALTGSHSTPTGPPSTPISSTSSVVMTPPTTPPSSQNWTCLSLSMVINQPWNSSYKNESSQEFHSRIKSEIKFLFKDTSKYGELKLQGQLDLKEKDNNIDMTVKLCIEVKKDDADSSVIDVLITLSKNGKLDKWKVKECSVIFIVIGVKLGDWEVRDDDECSKCSKGAGGPFVIKRDCTSKTQTLSCNGLKTKKSEDCIKYCGSCAVAGISSFTLIMGIILSFSFNIWK